MIDDILIMKDCLQHDINELHKEIKNVDEENIFVKGFLQGKLIEKIRIDHMLSIILYTNKEKNK
jgi:hypothetical protein